MPRMYTRLKRKLKLTSTFKHRYRTTQASARPRTFSTQQAAEAYAKEQSVEQYRVVSAKKNKRFKIVSA